MIARTSHGIVPRVKGDAASFTLEQSFPLPPCSATGTATWTATKA